MSRGKIRLYSQNKLGASSSTSHHVDGHLSAVHLENTDESNRQVNSSFVLSLRDDDSATIKELSDDGHPYHGTAVRGGLGRDSE